MSTELQPLPPEQKPGYLISFAKQTSMAGEMISINTTLPVGSTKEDIGHELRKLADAVEIRMEALNDKVLAKTGKTLEQLGYDSVEDFIDQAKLNKKQQR